MTEEWRVIHDFPDYAVSNIGRVKRVRTSTKGHRAGRLLSLFPGKIGYVQVSLCNGKTKKKVFVHALVLDAFVGPRPLGYVCNHLDSCRTNNRIDNLEWTSQARNVKHSYKMGREPISLSGSSNANAKLKEGEVWLIKRLLSSGNVKQKEIAKMFCITPEAVSLINCGVNWSHITYP